MLYWISANYKIEVWKIIVKSGEKGGQFDNVLICYFAYGLIG
jgi:hypothetical protein